MVQRFGKTLLDLLSSLDAFLSSPSFESPHTPVQIQKEAAQCFLLALQVLYDLCAQDLPDLIEANISTVIPLLHRYMSKWGDKQAIEFAQTAQSEDEPTEVEQIRSATCELVTLFSVRYLDAEGEDGKKFETQLPEFVEATWNLLTTLPQGRRWDLVCLSPDPKPYQSCLCQP